MHNYIRQLTISFLLILGLSGCGATIFSSRETNPVIEDYIGPGFGREIGTLATDAAHRVNMIRMKDGKRLSDGVWQRGEFCAEPPPDSMVNIAGAFGAAATANIKAVEPTTGQDIGEGSGNAQFYRTISTLMLPLLRRSQGLQWQRDGMSYACHAYLNRAITKVEYIQWVK